MKLKSYLLLSFLALLASFTVGVRYGQRVEQTNKTINYLLSITPTPKPTKTPTPTPVKYQEYKSKKWGLRFTFPQGWEIKENATAPAILFEIKK